MLCTERLLESMLCHVIPYRGYMSVILDVLARVPLWLQVRCFGARVGYIVYKCRVLAYIHYYANGGLYSASYLIYVYVLIESLGFPWDVSSDDYYCCYVIVR